MLLYKFFEDSPVDLSQWRLVLNLLADQSEQVMAAPRFDEIRHAGVCSEVRRFTNSPVVGSMKPLF